MEDWKLPVSARLAKELQAAREKIHELANSVENQIDCNADNIVEVLHDLGKAQFELDTCKKTISHLESEIYKLTARIRELEELKKP